MYNALLHSLAILSFSEGPLPSTIVDFWRMIWQEKVQTIAMVTNLTEGRHKMCEQYWPNTGSAEYGPFMVTLVETQVFADYTIRTFQLLVCKCCLQLA